MPSTSKKQQGFFFAELAKRKAGEPTKTKMTTQQIKDFTKLTPKPKPIGVGKPGEGKPKPLPAGKPGKKKMKLL